MILNVGNVVRIDNPTPDQVREHLRKLPLAAPFLILSDGADDGDRFIQTRPYSGGYRVEWRDGGSRRNTLVTFERAEELLCAYARRDESAVRSGADWHAMTWFNDPYYWLVATGVICGAILIFLLSAEVWHIVR
jgi:hypothetical protein